MENFQVIEFQRKRDFSNKMNATFEFIKQNFGPLCKSILIIAGPPVLIGSLLIGSFISDLFNIVGLGTTDPSVFEEYFTDSLFWIKLLFMFVFLIISGVVTIGTINNYILLYAEKRTNKIEVSEVWSRVRDTFWMYFGSMMMLILLLIAAYIIIAIPMGILIYAAPILAPLLVIALLIGAMYASIGIAFIFIIRAIEKKGFFEAVVRSFKLVRGKWWSTFGLLMVLYMTMGVISYLPILPFYIAMITETLHNVSSGEVPTNPFASMGIWVTVMFTIYYLIQMILYALPNVGIAFQYFNLVELKEAKGLLTEIETFGKPQETTTTRPEEKF
jgi:hypothetical protein